MTPPGSPQAAAPLVTRRGTVAIGGESVASLIARALEGRWTYEENLFKVVTSRTLTPGQARAARAALVGLSATQDPDTDLDLVRLCASTGASFEDALRPALPAAGSLRRAAELIEETMMSHGRLPAPAFSRHGRLAGFDSEPRPHHAIADQVKQICRAEGVALEPLAAVDALCERLAFRGPAFANMDAVAAALLLGLGVPASAAPFLKIIARLPVLAAVYLRETAARPNRYAGLIEGRPALLHESAQWQATVLDVLRADGSFVDLITRIALGHRAGDAEQRFFHAGLIAGAEYGKTASSSSVMRIGAAQGATFEEAYQAVMSTFGFYHLGALRGCAHFMALAAGHPGTLDDFIDRWLDRNPEAQGRVPGFGHRFQQADPRAAALLSMCRTTLPGQFMELAAALDERLYVRRLGHINMDGIGAAMGLQVGFPPAVISVLSLVARTAGLVKEFCDAAGTGTLYSLRVRDGLM